MNKKPKECGYQILSSHYDNGHNGGMWCAEKYPCKKHGKWEEEAPKYYNKCMGECGSTVCDGECYAPKQEEVKECDCPTEDGLWCYRHTVSYKPTPEKSWEQSVDNLVEGWWLGRKNFEIMFKKDIFYNKDLMKRNIKELFSTELASQRGLRDKEWLEGSIKNIKVAKEQARKATIAEIREKMPKERECGCYEECSCDDYNQIISDVEKILNSLESR